MTRVSAPPSKMYWRTRWKQGMEEMVATLPERLLDWMEVLSVYFKEASYHHRKCSRKIASNWRRSEKENKILKSLRISVIGYSISYTWTVEDVSSTSVVFADVPRISRCQLTVLCDFPVLGLWSLRNGYMSSLFPDLLVTWPQLFNLIISFLSSKMGLKTLCRMAVRFKDNVQLLLSRFLVAISSNYYWS